MPRGITEQEVFEAADALLTRGERPTIERVRQELGRGSPNRVNTIMDAWWTGLADRLRGAQAPGLPASLVQACTRLYEEMRRQSLGESERMAAEQAKQVQQAQRELEQERTALAAEKAGVLATVEALKNDLSDLRSANQELVRRSARQEAEMDAAKREAAAAVLRAGQAGEERERVAAAGREDLERLREQWQGNERRWLGEIDHLRDENRRLRAEGERMQKAFNARAAELAQQLSEGVKERSSLRQAAEAAERELAKEREKRNFAEGALAASRASKKAAPSPSMHSRKARNRL